MKILILTDGVHPFVIGGMQKHSFYLAKNLAEQGHQIVLVHCVEFSKKLPTKDELELVFGLEALSNIEFISLKFPAPSWYPGHYLKESYLYSKQAFDKVKKRLAEFEFIYAKGFTAWYFLERKSKGEKMAPVGIKFHGYEMFQPPANFKGKIHNWLLKGPTLWINLHADYVFSYGGKITSIIRKLGVGDKKIIEIPTGIESAWCIQKIPAHGQKIRLVFIGRFERRKGIEELTAALRELKDNVDFHFDFIGPIPPSVRIKSDKIEYHGSISDKTEIQKILDKCQVLVVPSHSEGMPNVIMEGMARGLAILATDVGAITSVVSEQNGWFVTPGDTLALSQMLRQIMETDWSHILSKQQHSLDQIKLFFWDRIAAKTAEEISKRLR